MHEFYLYLYSIALLPRIGSNNVTLEILRLRIAVVP
jgi:hypothetical protein